MGLLDDIPDRYSPKGSNKLNWARLQYGKCPKCPGNLKDFFKTKTINCDSCNFKIGQQKCAEILYDKKQSLSNYDEEARMAEWNNYGRKENTDSFL